jgi:Tol biopolymer transport system component
LLLIGCAAGSISSRTANMMPTNWRPIKAAAFTLLMAASGALMLTAHSPASAAFPGVNGRIAFQSDRDCNCDVYDIYVMNSDGTGQTNLTNSAVDDQAPAWSPDGTKIAFASTRNGNTGDIYVMNSNGAGETSLTTNMAADTTPAWSPDGSKIAFMSDRDGRYQIYMMNSDGTGQVNLTNDPGCDQFPAWSPDGSKIAFQSDRDGPPHVCAGGVGSAESSNEIYVMNANGTNQTRLTNNSAFDGHRANWSPDGTRIVFASERDGNAEIYVMNADGTGQTNLTNSLVNDGYPAWSPDGTTIAFESSTVAGSREVFVMNADGSGKVDLTNNPARDYLPDWQRRCAGDMDCDGVTEPPDNCPTVPNGPTQAGIPGVGNQTNTDGNNAASNLAGQDTLGDACDNDKDGDGYTAAQEAGVVPAKSDLAYCDIMRADVDGDGVVSILDLSQVAASYLKTIPPAPERRNQDGDMVISILDLSKMAPPSVYLKHVTDCP